MASMLDTEIYRLMAEVRGTYLVHNGQVMVGSGTVQRAIDWCEEHGLEIDGLDPYDTDGETVMFRRDLAADTPDMDIDEWGGPSATWLLARVLAFNWDRAPQFVAIRFVRSPARAPHQTVGGSPPPAPVHADAVRVQWDPPAVSPRSWP